MSQLIKLRQQIKTIKTIQKITQAMRLVSMSVHSRLNNQKNYLKLYQTEFAKIGLVTNEFTGLVNYTQDQSAPKLLILVGSQKGLCGGFNQDILRKYSQYHKATSQHPFELYVIGKKLIDVTQNKYQINHKVSKFTPATLEEIVNNLFEYTTKQKKFSEVLFFSNSSRTFFTHDTKINSLFANDQQIATNSSYHNESYIWEQDPNELAQAIYHNQIKINIYCLLFESLIAEYAARFRSMDTATRNANTLLENAERQYRKVRQTKITRELVELSAIFQTK